jgi:hypothetical protein
MYVLRSKGRIGVGGYMDYVYAGYDRRDYPMPRPATSLQHAFLYDEKDLAHMDPSWLRLPADYDSEGTIRRTDE